MTLGGQFIHQTIYIFVYFPHSLTPPSVSNLSPASSTSASEWVTKGRSHSLTNHAGISEAKTISPAGSASALDEKEIEEMIKLLPEGSGMRGKANIPSIPEHDFEFLMKALQPSYKALRCQVSKIC